MQILQKKLYASERIEHGSLELKANMLTTWTPPRPTSRHRLFAAYLTVLITKNTWNENINTFHLG